MKQTAILSTVLLVLSAGVFTACQPAADNRAVTTATPTPETVDTAAIEAELKRIENDWPRVVREKDVAAVRRVEADDAMFVYPDGTVGTKEQDIKDMETGALTADSWEVLDLKVNVLDADAATVMGHTRVTNGKYKMPDGKTIDISGEYRFIDTFVRRNGEWKLVAGAGSRVMTPSAAASPTASPKASPATAASPAVRTSPATRPSPATSATP